MLFSAKPTKPTSTEAGKGRGNGPSKRPSGGSVLDGRRLNNVGIVYSCRCPSGSLDIRTTTPSRREVRHRCDTRTERERASLLLPVSAKSYPSLHPHSFLPLTPPSALLPPSPTDFKKSFRSSDDIVRTVLGLVRERVPVERLPGLLEILPRPDEMKKLAAARADPTGLNDAELFMLTMMKVRCGGFERGLLRAEYEMKVGSMPEVRRVWRSRATPCAASSPRGMVEG